jgi:hypothetical protein
MIDDKGPTGCFLQRMRAALQSHAKRRETRLTGLFRRSRNWQRNSSARFKPVNRDLTGPATLRPPGSEGDSTRKGSQLSDKGDREIRETMNDEPVVPNEGWRTDY